MRANNGDLAFASVQGFVRAARVTALALLILYLLPSAPVPAQSVVWRQIQLTARDAAAMAYDSNRGLTVLFGGLDSSGTLNDAWEWNGASWNPAVSGPSRRGAHAMAYDS